MEKEFIPYEQALALKELGFDEPCIACYTENAFGSTPEQKVQYWREPIGGNDDYVFVLAPLYQQAFRWFREKYDLYSQTPSTCIEESNRIFYNNPIYDELDNIVFDSMEQYTTYEEVELECLKKLIEIVKNK